MKSLLKIIALLIFLHGESSAYSVKGKIILDSSWNSKVYLCELRSVKNVSGISEAWIIDSTSINPDGTFKIGTKILPSENALYRLHIVPKGKPTAYLKMGVPGENFVLLILNNNSSVTLTADSKDISATYIVDDPACCLLKHIRVIRNDCYMADFDPEKWADIQTQIQPKLKEFIDTSGNIIAAIVAANYYDYNDSLNDKIDYFTALDEKFLSASSNSPYVKEFHQRIENAGMVKINKVTVFGTSGGIIIFLILIIRLLKMRSDKKIEVLKNKLKEFTENKNNPENNLTQKEKEIFNLIGQGLSNKEIAQRQFIEVSTVKTHINNIYNKLNIANRKEAILSGKSANSL